MGVMEILGNVAGGYAGTRKAKEADERAKRQDQMMNKMAVALGGKAEVLGGEEEAQRDKVKEIAGKAGRGVLGALKSVGKFFTRASKGGYVKKSGLVRVHKGEAIIPANQTIERKTLRKVNRRSGARSSSRR